ncbi:MAG: PD40 domain-containing protein [Ignavibacteriales bacterium]|nr:PD40 domain-containing protein [Ignavibacteriales bacterium]
MKNLTIFLLLSHVLFVSVANAQQNRAEKLYQQGLYETEALGNYTKAIELFNRVVTEFPKEKPIAAKALLQIGICHEKLGNAEAQKAYERVIKEFADQREVVAAARIRLSALAQNVDGARLSSMAARQVWAGPDADGEGSPSPDGRYLTFVDWSTGNLALRDLTTSENRPLTKKGSWTESYEFAGGSVFSPTGKKIAYTWFSKEGYLGFQLRAIRTDGTDERVIYQDNEVPYLSPAAWSPDERYILASLFRNDRTTQIVLISVADGKARILKSLDGRYRGQLCFSPDGRYVAYSFTTGDNSQNSDIYVLAADGNRETTLVKHPADDLLMGWSPDGERIIFSSDRAGTTDIWSVNVVDGKPRSAPQRLQEDINRRTIPMGFTKSGSFFYALLTGLRDVYVAGINQTFDSVTTLPEPVASRITGSNFAPEWSRDGKSLAFISRRGPGTGFFGGHMIIIRSLQTGLERELPLTLAYVTARLRWSPDGSRFVVTGTGEDDQHGIFMIDSQNGKVNPFAYPSEEGSMVLRYPYWSSDGHSLFYVSQGKKQTALIRRDLGTGKRAEVYRAPNEFPFLSIFQVSPDGRWVAIGYHHALNGRSVNLLVVPASGGEAREVLRLEDPEWLRALAWTPDGRNILFSRHKGTGPDERDEGLWCTSMNGGFPERVDLNMPVADNLGFHPDGSRIAFDSGERQVEIWVMENFLPKESGKNEK